MGVVENVSSCGTIWAFGGLAEPNRISEQATK